MSDDKSMGFRGFPGGSVVKNLFANAVDMGSILSLGRSHLPWSNKARLPQLLSLCSRARELQLLSPCTPEPVLWSTKRPLQWEAHALQWRAAPTPAPSREVPTCSNKKTETSLIPLEFNGKCYIWSQTSVTADKPDKFESKILIQNQFWRRAA